MGPIAASKLDEIISNVVYVVAIEMMCAAQAFDLLGDRPGKGTAVAHEGVRSVVPTYLKDRIVAPDIEKVANLIRSWELLEAVEHEVGPVRLTLRGKGRVYRDA
jgi:histidine ammonia-lyase